MIICLGFVSAVALAQKPNIILVMTDDQGWFDTGFKSTHGPTQLALIS